MTKEETINQCEQYVLHTYNRFPLVIDHGEGTTVYDTDGRQYLDFMSGIGVYALGYHYPGYDEALIAQVKKVLHTSNLYYHEPLAEAAKNVVESTGMSKVFFTNSGAEAIEGSLKAARKYAYLKDGHNDHEIIAMNSSFHGRSIGALSVTGNEAYRDPFKPLMGGVVFADYNDLASVRARVTDKTCAIIMETVQGEGGIYPADPDFIRGVEQICRERDILLILDEIQCGMGRSGSMWAFQQFGVTPDIVTCAKALGCGVPVGAFVMNQKVAEHSLTAGDHGTTYGGNPFVCSAVNAVFKLFRENDIVGHVQVISKYLAEKLDGLMASHRSVVAHRGLGLIRGLELDPACASAGKAASLALEKGLMIITAGHNVIRFVPPLVITEDDVDKATAILDEVLTELEKN
ncbi:MAG: aspartate aminotransferase family protein [Chordicoccus sp.]|jgi:acetylornithine/N-succinyldiaminopimelate aminotransferase